MTAVDKGAHIWERDALDWYQEPESCTDALLAVEAFSGPIHDPSCGGGNIVRSALRHGKPATGSDVVCRVAPRPEWFLGERDFLAQPFDLVNVIMNPPFFRAKGAEAFIRTALGVTASKVAAFVDVKFLAGAQRANGLFAQHPPARVWIVTPRPSCPPGEWLKAGNKAGGGTADWCWIVWDNSAPGAATSLGWIRSGREPQAIAVAA